MLPDIEKLIASAGLAHVPLALSMRVSSQSFDWVQGAWPDGWAVAVDDRFYGASLAKQVTGALVALLVRRAGLDPDMSIGAVLPDLPDWGGSVTIRHLLHHLGGLPDVDSAAETGHWDLAAAMRILRASPELPATPGSRFRYSNLGYVCLALVIEHVGGVVLAELAQNHLFDPLGLTGIGFSPSPDFPQLAGMGPIHPLTVGDGGLWTSATAFADWLDHQNRDTLGIADLVQQPHGVANDYGWGLGIRSLAGHPLFIHGGGWTGAYSKAVRCPALGLSIVALAATDTDAGVISLVDALARQVTV